METYLDVMALLIVAVGCVSFAVNFLLGIRKRHGIRKLLRLTDAAVILYVVVIYSADSFIPCVGHEQVTPYSRFSVFMLVSLFLANAIIHWDTK